MLVEDTLSISSGHPCCFSQMKYGHRSYWKPKGIRDETKVRQGLSPDSHGILVGVGAALLTTRAQLNYSSASVHSMQRAFDEVTERAMVTKIIFSRSGHGPQTVLLWKQESTR